MAFVKSSELLAILFCPGLLYSIVCPRVEAEGWDKKTTITFSGPVMVAGNHLDGGTYVFKLADTADRHVVQIFNEDETQLIDTLLAIPDYRMARRDHTPIKFAETADESAGLPVVEWLCPGDNEAQEFPKCPVR